MGKKTRGKKAPAAAEADKPAAVTREVIANGTDSFVEADSNRACVGVRTSHPDSRDVKIESFSLSFYSKQLLSETTLELNFGRRYGLIGANGCGKSTLLKCIVAREIPIPDHIDIYLLSEEYPPTKMTALEAVIQDAKGEMQRLEALAETIMVSEPDSPLLEDIYERLDTMDPSTFEARASQILYGLGFTSRSMEQKTEDLSGGWRMRVALARALFVRPTLLLLDQPTNHLYALDNVGHLVSRDLGACVWLEEFLKTYNRILVVVSHSQDFLNNVCTNICLFDHKKQLVYYTGNYDQMVTTKAELEVNQMKAYEKQQAEIEHMQKFIRSCGTYANLVKQAKSRQKIIDKMQAAGLVEKVEGMSSFEFYFQSSGQLPPPVLQFNEVSFAYSGKPQDYLYENIDLGLDTESRVALVGPNGAGKSTLLKLLMGQLSPQHGSASTHSHLKIVHYSQHSADQLDLNKSACDYLRDKFEDLPRDLQFWRQQVGRFGLTSNDQLCPMEQLSDGQRSRVVFAEMSLSNGNMLLLDEPTNALDIETIDSLALALNTFDGGVVLVSHDFRLISKVAQQIWLCENKKVTLWEGSIGEYKEHLKKQVLSTMRA